MKSLKNLSLRCLMVLSLFGFTPVIAHADDMMMKSDGMMKDTAMMGDNMKPQVAISGYCPVCLVHGKLNKGSDNFTTEYKGKVYKFTGIDMQKMFLKNPDKYTKDLDMKYKKLGGM